MEANAKEKITCAICDSDAVTRVTKTFAATYNQVPVSVENVEMYECASCGETFFSPEQARNLTIAIKNQVRRQNNLLSSQEIIDIRKRLGLSQNALEQLFGLGPKVVTRWETGRVVQGKMADVALRLLAMSPDLLKKLGSPDRRRKPAHVHA